MNEKEENEEEMTWNFDIRAITRGHHKGKIEVIERHSFGAYSSLFTWHDDLDAAIEYHRMIVEDLEAKKAKIESEVKEKDENGN